MTFLGVIGIILGLAAYSFAFVEPSRVRVGIFFAAYLVHIATTVLFFAYAQDNVTDSAGYYHDDFGFAEDGFGIATQFLFYTVQKGRDIFGGTFLDYFLIFQVFGFFGICMLMRIFEEVYASFGIEQPLYSYALLFIPGIHFWTSAIGKDAPLFLGVCLSLWAAMNLKRRYPWLAAGIGIILIIRPHIALIAAAAVAITLIFDRRVRLFTKIVLMILALAGVGFTAATVESTFRVDVTSADSVSDFLSTHDEVIQDAHAAGSTAVYGSYPVRLLSLLFRPMFWDAEGIFGYVASAENLLLLFVLGYLTIHVREALVLVKHVAFLRFALVVSVTIALMLALIYYNVGLGLRQKTMFVPGLLLLFLSVAALRQTRSLARVDPEGVHLQTGAATPAPANGAVT
jgi:hypothetical protein